MDNTTNFIILASITAITTGAYFIFKSLFYTKIPLSDLSFINHASITELPLYDSSCLNDLILNNNLLISNINTNYNHPFSHLPQSIFNGQFPLGYLQINELNLGHLINNRGVPLADTMRGDLLNTTPNTDFSLYLIDLINNGQNVLSNRLDLVNISFDYLRFPTTYLNYIPEALTLSDNDSFSSSIIWQNFSENVLIFLNNCQNLPIKEKIITATVISSILFYCCYAAVTTLSGLIGATMNYIDSIYKEDLLNKVFSAEPLELPLQLKYSILSHFPRTKWVELSSTFDTILTCAGLNIDQQTRVLYALYWNINRESRPLIENTRQLSHRHFDLRDAVPLPFLLTDPEAASLALIKAALGNRCNYFFVGNDRTVGTPVRQPRRPIVIERIIQQPIIPPVLPIIPDILQPPLPDQIPQPLPERIPRPLSPPWQTLDDVYTEMGISRDYYRTFP